MRAQVGGPEPLGWWPQGETVGSTPDVSLGIAVRSGVPSSPNPCPSVLPAFPVPALRESSWRGSLCGLLCWKAASGCSEGPGAGISWKFGGLGSFQKHLEVGKWCCCCHRLSETLPGLCCRWQLGASPCVLRSSSPCCFVSSCLIYETLLGWVSLSTEMSWVPASGLDLLGGGDISQHCWSIAALLTEQLMDVNIALAFYLQLVLGLCLELSFFSKHADLFWTINLTASE